MGTPGRARAAPALYPHRLGRAYGPDSSRAALTRTLEQPIDGLETDCCLTADEQLVLLHDPLLEIGTTLSGWAHERTAAQLRDARLRDHDGTPSDERPLLLDELLEQVPAEMALQLEIKAHADADLALRTAAAVCRRRRDDPTRERIELISFWAGACKLAAGLGFRARLLLVADYCSAELAAWAHGAGLSGVGVEHGLLSRALVQTLHAAGLGVGASPSTSERSSRRSRSSSWTWSRATPRTSCARRSAGPTRQRRPERRGRVIRRTSAKRATLRALGFDRCQRIRAMAKAGRT